MVNPHWPDRLRDELAKRGLPATYSDRLLEELTEHRNAIEKENQSMEALASAEERLGTPESLAAAARKERTCAGRHPFLAFVIGPILVTQLVWHLLVFVLLVPLKWFVTPYEPATMLPPTGVEWFIAYACLYVMRFLPFTVLAPFFIRTGRKCCRPVWGTVACGMVTYMAFVNYMGVDPPNEKHNLCVWFTWKFGLHDWQGRLLSAAIPLVFSIWAWKRFGNSTRTSRPRLPLSAATSV